MTREASAGASPDLGTDDRALGTTGEPQEPSQSDLLSARLDEI